MSKGIVLLAAVTLILTLAFFLLVRPLLTFPPPPAEAPRVEPSP